MPEEDLPLLIPDPEKKVATLYGMIHMGVTSEKPIRSVFVIDPQGKIRFIAFYPMKNGRNFEEIARMIAAMQKTDEKGSYVTPPDWKIGDDPANCVPCSQLKK
jgi:peroxiredoxin (alkyl hydroperoxide reductase subunit C)